MKPNNQHDGQLEAKHVPKNKLTELERQRIIKAVNEPDYADSPPSKIVSLLADEGRYLASESTFYCVLKTENQLQHRQKSKPVRQIKKPQALTASGANQLYDRRAQASSRGLIIPKVVYRAMNLL